MRSHRDFQFLQIMVIKRNSHSQARAHLRAESWGTPDPHGPTTGWCQRRRVQAARCESDVMHAQHVEQPQPGHQADFWLRTTDEPCCRRGVADWDPQLHGACWRNLHLTCCFLRSVGLQHVLANFPCLNKVCFFGDPRQCKYYISLNNELRLKIVLCPQFLR